MEKLLPNEGDVLEISVVSPPTRPAPLGLEATVDGDF
jgi:hypothetical protein